MGYFLGQGGRGPAPINWGPEEIFGTKSPEMGHRWMPPSPPLPFRTVNKLSTAFSKKQTKNHTIIFKRDLLYIEKTAIQSCVLLTVLPP